MRKSKIIIYIAVVCFICIASGNSFAQTRPKVKGASSKVAMATFPLNTTNNNKAVFRESSLSKTIVSFLVHTLDDQKACAANVATEKCTSNAEGTVDDCTNTTCDNTPCINKIICCHTIDVPTFTAIVSGLGSPVHMILSDVSTSASGADCSTDFIRILIRKVGGTERFELSHQPKSDTASPPDTTVLWKSYYSVAFFMGVLGSTPAPVSFDFYKGIELKTGKSIMLFAATFSDKSVKLYDVSNDIP